MIRILHNWRVIAIQDAYKRMPWADVLYGCNNTWWQLHNNCERFMGERWAPHHGGKQLACNQLKLRESGIKLVELMPGDKFSMDPGVIMSGSHSGFQATNLAISFGVTHIALVGHDLRNVDGKIHFFGEHKGLHNNDDWSRFIPIWRRGAKSLPDHISIVNCTPGSAIDAFPMGDLRETATAWHHSSVHRNRALSDG
jgi:hypothetical protein